MDLANYTSSFNSTCLPTASNNVKEWAGFFEAVRLGVQQHNLPTRLYQSSGFDRQPLRVEYDAKLRLYVNAALPVKELLPQGVFGATPAGFLGASDLVLCTNNFAEAKMPV
ncbi:hypothetical protein C2G38_2033242 [Gigaspora rosea]|uniref:Uncharacterized protein n=1 Tax=Gigaspora rosea TaxID=44941 RepID=A0A397VM10_9GLOM|nr:hypothetical protein C2G38_2033242 [Gigaspora rosea]